LTAKAFAKGGINAKHQTKECIQQAKKKKDRETLVELRAWKKSVRKTQIGQMWGRWDCGAW
jgi:hypothetical protein